MEHAFHRRPKQSHSSGTLTRDALRLLLVLVVLGLTLAGGGLPARAAGQVAADLPTTLAFAPEGTAAYVGVDLRLGNEQWAQTQTLLTQTGFSDALPSLRTLILDQLAAATGDAAPADDPFFGGELGVVVPAAAVTAFFSGEAFQTAVGATPEPAAAPESGTAAGPVVALQPGDPDAAFAALEPFLADTAGTEYQGVTISPIAPVGDLPDSVVARVDDTLLFAATAAELEPLIDAGQGRAPSLAAFDPVGQVRAELPSAALLFAFLDNVVINDAYPPELAAQNEALMGDVPEEANRSYAGLSVSADDLGFRFDSIQIPAADGSLDPLLPAADFRLTSDQRVPASTFLFLGGSVPNFNGLTAAFGPMLALLVTQGVDPATPGATPTNPFLAASGQDIEAQFADAERILGFDLRADLLDLLGGEILFAADIPGFGAGGFEFDSVAAVGVDDPTTAADSLARYARVLDQRPDVDVTARSAADSRIFVVRPEDRGDQAFPIELPVLEFGVVADELLIGVGDGLDRYLDGPETGLADDPQYRQVLAALPDEEPYFIFYSDLSQIAPFLGDLAGANQGGSGIVDSHPDCDAFADEAAAQAAYDDDPLANANLDQDFDGLACEDRFAAATPDAAIAGPGAIKAFAQIAYVRDGLPASSGILYIAPGEE